MLWGPISLMGFFCMIVFLGFSLLSLLAMFKSKGNLLNSFFGLMLAAVFFSVFAFGAVKVQQYNEIAGDKLTDHPTVAIQKQLPLKK
ncbi:hypothetical protein JQN58_04685 [Aneurinibacillus sp. BA2021]|nr:hypothetical protein [Aneurinibacillus sp. BA2021]